MESKAIMQQGQRIYFTTSFYKHFPGWEYLNFEPNLRQTEPARYATFWFLFNELISRSPYFFNFLEYQKRHMKDYIKYMNFYVTDINDAPPMEMEYAEDGILIIVISPKFYNEVKNVMLARADAGEVYLKESDRVSYLLHNTYPLRDIDIIKPTQAKTIAKLFMELNYTIDKFLREIPDFEELPHIIKTRIINSEFLNGMIPTDNTDIKIEEIIENIKNQNIRNYDDTINTYNNKVSQYQKEIESYERQKQEVIANKLYFLENNKLYTLEKLKRVLENKTIDFFKVINDIIEIHTKPIMLNIVREKANSITSVKKREAVKQGKNLCIGRHIIQVNPQSMQFNYEAKDGLLNYHIEHYTCYGTFRNSISEATKAKNLPKIIALALQMLSQATIGDPAGTSTINNAFIVDKDNLVITKKGKQPILDYLRVEQFNNTIGGASYANI